VSLEIGVMKISDQLEFLGRQIEKLTAVLKQSELKQPTVAEKPAAEVDAEKPANKPAAEKKTPSAAAAKAKAKAKEAAAKADKEEKQVTEADFRATLTKLQQHFTTIAKTTAEKNGAKDRCRVVMNHFGGSKALSEIKPESYASIVDFASKVMAAEDNGEELMAEIEG